MPLSTQASNNTNHLSTGVMDGRVRAFILDLVTEKKLDPRVADMWAKVYVNQDILQRCKSGSLSVHFGADTCTIELCKVYFR